jgi:DNA-binding MarR family transcriptional regulator
MLTELLRARLARRRLSVTSLCLASKSPVTTALRRIERLLEAGLVSCTQDPKDRRRKYIELTALGTEKVQETLQAIAQRLRGEETTVS